MCFEQVMLAQMVGIFEELVATSSDVRIALCLCPSCLRMRRSSRVWRSELPGRGRRLPKVRVFDKVAVNLVLDLSTLEQNRAHGNELVYLNIYQIDSHIDRQRDFGVLQTPL